jgi:hypothetical protein
MSVLAIIFVYVAIPETKGLSFQEVEALWEERARNTKGWFPWAADSLQYSRASEKSVPMQILCVWTSTKGCKAGNPSAYPYSVRTIGSSSVELLQVISDPPQGSENLLMQVLHILTEGRTPSRDLIMTVKQLYESKWWYISSCMDSGRD